VDTGRPETEQLLREALQSIEDELQREQQAAGDTDPSVCPHCRRTYNGRRGVTTHLQKNQECGKRAKMCPIMIPSSVLATGLFGISRMKKGVEKGLDEIRKGVRKGLNEIEGEVKRGLKENKKELEKLEKEGRKERERVQKEKARKGVISEESDTEEMAVMAPLITKSGSAHYQPWAHSDVSGLIARLPVLHEGAGRWINKLESETQGRDLAVGDMKCLLSLILGKADTEAVLDKEGLGYLMTDAKLDAWCFDQIRPRVWKALRAAYPNQYSPSAVWIEKLKDSDNPAAFVERAAQEWTIRMEQRPEDSGPATMQFRRAVMDALPKEVRTQLENDWRLAIMPKEEFRMAVVHQVTLYRQGKDREEQQEREATRKLTHVQLQEAKGAKKAATQAPVMPTTAPVPQPQQPVTQQPMAQQPVMMQPQPVQPIVQTWQQAPYGPPPQQQQGQQWYQPRGRGGFRQGRGGQGRGGQGRGQYQGQQNQGNNIECWICGGIGHIFRNCPTKARGQNNQGGQANQGQMQGGLPSKCRHPLAQSPLTGETGIDEAQKTQGRVSSPP